MSNNFKGSIAQKNVQFPIETVIEPLAGENYSRAMIFVPNSKAAEYLGGIDGTEINKLYEITSSNYGTIATDLLLTWLVPFFKNATAVKVGIVIYDDGEDAGNTLSVCYEKFKMWAYFKFAIHDEDNYVAQQVALATLCLPDSLYSDCWIGTSDKNVMSSTSTLITQLKNASCNPRIIYNPDTTKNPALAQLGKTLSVANSQTGTPIGNSTDMVAFSTIGASGDAGDDGSATNLSSTDCAALDNQKIGYQTYVGDGTENVVTEGSLTLQGESVGANWVKHYIEYMCKVKTATMITRMNVYRNNATYQKALLILSDIVQDFVDLGRLDGFTITAPIFADLADSGDSFIVPNAWEATYIDTTREVTIYGTLYMTEPTR